MDMFQNCGDEAHGNVGMVGWLGVGLGDLLLLSQCCDSV